jgi:hypothetical protein
MKTELYNRKIYLTFPVNQIISTQPPFFLSAIPSVPNDSKLPFKILKPPPSP